MRCQLTGGDIVYHHRRYEEQRGKQDMDTGRQEGGSRGRTGRQTGKEVRIGCRGEDEEETYSNVHLRLLGNMKRNLSKRLHILKRRAFVRSETMRSSVYPHQRIPLQEL